MINPAKGVIVAQRYELSRPLARGGMGSVWIARHRDLDVDVTIKFMGPALVASSEARMRFEREARVAARLDSQHVVHVQDYGVEDETPYLVMELLKGDSLAGRLARDGTLSLAAATPLLLQMCKALRTAHDAGLVHRDLKPGNVFLARKDEDEVVKILDFGIAKAGDLGDATASTESGVLMGSVHYMSPEQIRNSRAVDQRSDLWSIAVILYRALGGRLPFPGDKMGDVLVRVCTEPFPLLSSLVTELPPGIDAFFARALERNPDRRFQTATEMASAFSAMILEATAPPAPPPASVTEPSWLSKEVTAVMQPRLPPPATTVPLVGGRPLPPAVGPPMPPSPHLAVPAAAPARLAPVPVPVADAPAPSAPAIEQPSQITLLNATSPPRRPKRMPLIAAVLVPFALVVIGGAVVSLGNRGGVPQAPPGSSALGNAGGAPQTAPIGVDTTSREAAAAPAESAAASVDPSATAASEARPAATSAPAVHAPTHKSAGKSGCNPPYTLDARGLRVPKMECL